MKRFVILQLILLTCCSFFCFGQKEDVVNDELLLKIYLNTKRFPIDSSAQAIILYEQGYSSLSDNVLEYHIERTIKFLGDDAISALGVINIPYKDRMSITKIEVTTYNWEGNGVVQQSISSSDVIKEKINENISISKFNLPGIKKGSIVHYSYSIYRNETLLVPEWNFQNDYPTLYSEYSIKIPANITYNSIERLNVPMKTVKKKKELNDCESCSYSENYGASQDAMHKWVRRNIPAFKAEPFMSSADNFRERVKINIVNILNNGFKTQVFNNWEDFTKKYFYGDEEFGGQVFSGNNFLKEKTDELTKNQKTDLDKAHAIFSFVRSNFVAASTATGDKAELNIKDIFSQKTGSPEGINLLLTAMLRKANLDSEPVLLSTRENERLNSVYIDPQNINYVISKVNIDKKVYLLDATNKYNPFNTLPSACYNGYCRTISKSGGTALILDPDSIKNKTTIIANLAAAPDSSKLILKINKQYGVFTAIAMRKRWAGDTAEVRKYIARELNTGTTSNTVTNISVTNLDDPDQPLNLHYEILIDFDRSSKTIYMDPFFSKFFSKSPLPQTKRKYTIEMDQLEDINYLLYFELPEGYTLDDYPKSVVHQYGEDQLLTMKSIMSYDEPTRVFSLNSRFTSKTTLFSPEDYESLRNFYEHVIEEQSKRLIIKKLN